MRTFFAAMVAVLFVFAISPAVMAGGGEDSEWGGEGGSLEQVVGTFISAKELAKVGIIPGPDATYPDHHELPRITIEEGLDGPFWVGENIFLQISLAEEAYVVAVDQIDLPAISDQQGWQNLFHGSISYPLDGDEYKVGIGEGGILLPDALVVFPANEEALRVLLGLRKGENETCINCVIVTFPNVMWDLILNQVDTEQKERPKHWLPPGFIIIGEILRQGDPDCWVELVGGALMDDEGRGRGGIVARRGNGKVRVHVHWETKHINMDGDDGYDDEIITKHTQTYDTPANGKGVFIALPKGFIGITVDCN